MRTIGVVTTSRSDYGIIRPVIKRIYEDPDLELKLYVSGSHLSPDLGYTVEEIEFPIFEKIEGLTSSDTPEGIGKSTALTTMGFSQSFSRYKPDILLLVGDRYEMLAVAIAAMPFNIPIAHLGGGDVTYGAFDEYIRHAITKFSHYHFPYAYENKLRILQMGEDPERVFVTGNPANESDNLAKSYGEPLARDCITVIFHPVTLEYEKTKEYIRELLSALEYLDDPIVFILPNAATCGRVIIKAIRKWTLKHNNAQAHMSLIPDRFYDLLRNSLVLVGNSSSGLMEAPSFNLPVVNIGNRQRGRVRGKNVVDVNPNRVEIRNAIIKAINKGKGETIKNPYLPFGDVVKPSLLITAKLKECDLRVTKEFVNFSYELPQNKEDDNGLREEQKR